MFQKYFEPSEHLHFEGDKLPKISRYVLSDLLTGSKNETANPQR